MAEHKARKDSVEIYRGGKKEVRGFVVGAISDREAVEKIDAILKHQNSHYQVIAVIAIDIEESRYSKKELRIFAHRDALAKKKTKEYYFGKTRIRNYNNFVRLNYADYYPDAA